MGLFDSGNAQPGPLAPPTEERYLANAPSETGEDYWSKAHRLADALRKHLTITPVPYDFTRLDHLLGYLQEWRNEDQEDGRLLHRSDIIEIIEGVKALRKERP